jgi:phage gpG-like protein
MAIQINMKATHAGNKLEKLRDYLRNPFTRGFVKEVQDKLRANIMSSENRPLKYHTYKSDAPGTLAGTCFVEKQGNDRIILGSYEPYAGVLEYGRNPQTRANSRKPFVFRGYYANPAAVRMALNNAKSSKLYSPIAEFMRTRSSIAMSRGGGIIKLKDAEGTTRRAGGKGGVSGKETIFGKRKTPGGNVHTYNPALKGEQMRKQNVAFLSYESASKIVDVKKKGVIAPNKVSHVNDYSDSVIKGAEPQRGTPRFRVKGKKAYKNALPYGKYTVFSSKLKGIRPYHVFTKTAEWAEEKFVNEVKRAVRKIDMNMAT